MDSALRLGQPDIASVGPIAFGPDDVLFVADNTNAKVVAIDVGDQGPEGPATPLEVEDLDGKLAAFLGCPTEDVVVKDMAVHPRTHNVYLSVTRGRGDGAIPLILRIDHGDATVSEVPLESIPFAEASIADAPDADDTRTDFRFAEPPEGEVFERNGHTFRIARPPVRSSTVTDLAYVDGMVLVAGLSNEEFSSKLRRIPFPFVDDIADSSLEIFHVSHGKWETAAPIRTFVPYDGDRSILASYTCTPLVHFSLDDLAPGTKTVGRTVAELGAANQPLDIVTFVRDGEEHVLVANSAHGLVKITRRDIDGQAPLTEAKEPVGVPRETTDHEGIIRLANIGDSFVLALQVDDSGAHHLRSLKTSAL
jgi:hypothetical protein